MAILIIGLILWIIILIYNTVYSFLPVNLQGILWVKICAVIGASIILIIGVKKSFQEFKDYKFAYISSQNGSILKRKNFKWKINKTSDKDTGDIIFIIEERYGDASDITISLEKSVKYETYNAMDGVGIRFKCLESEIPNFKIEIKK